MPQISGRFLEMEQCYHLTLQGSELIKGDSEQAEYIQPWESGAPRNMSPGELMQAGVGKKPMRTS